MTCALSLSDRLCLQRHANTAARHAEMLVSLSSVLVRLLASQTLPQQERLELQRLQRDLEQMVLEATQNSADLKRKASDELSIAQSCFTNEKDACNQNLQSRYEEAPSTFPF